jgi:hypothetical protein
MSMAQAAVIDMSGPERSRPAAGRPVGTGTKLKKFCLVSLGLLLIVAGQLIGLLPGPLGMPLTVAGLSLVLRNSVYAKRRFIDLMHRWPNVLVPIRRLLKPKPEVASVFWQQLLRIERALVRRRNRVLVRWRLRRKARRAS